MINKKNSFYEKYRPMKFKNFIGNKYIIKSLLYFFKRKKFPSSFVFFGNKGTGKTTLSKLFAKSLNCILKPKICNKCKLCKSINKNDSLDFREIDAASFRTVEEINNIFQDYLYRPIFMKYKIYVLDESHMLSKHAFNSLLNILENLPSFVKIIFVTTEINKIPETILSRCIKFKFYTSNKENSFSYIKRISKKENIKISKRSIRFLVNISKGSLRDCLVNLEQTSSVFNKKIKLKAIYKYFDLTESYWSLRILKYIIFLEKKKFLRFSKKIKNLNFLNILKSILENLNEILILREIKNLNFKSTIFENYEKIYFLSNFSKNKSIFFLRNEIIFEIRNFPKYNYFSYYNFLSSVLKIIYNYKVFKKNEK